MKFHKYRIAEEIKEALKTKGFKKPTDIQYRAIPSILKGEDVLAIAQTGTGKTAAFVIPILDKIVKSKTSSRSSGVKCLVMVPTRELAVQINDVIAELGRYLKVKSVAIYGGADQDPQIKTLNNGVDIVVTTPGRMFDLASQGHLDLSRVDTLVLDEADHMLDLGFIKDIKDVIRKLPQNRQTLFFSATINPTIKKLAYSIVNNPVRIQISPKDPVSKNVDHYVIRLSMDDKRFYLERIVNENSDKKILVFVRTKVRAERVKEAMTRVGIDALTMHGDKEQSERLDILNEFKAGDTKLLIATDVSARGIDIPDVEIVINYDLPDYTENYVHRVGRTGRGRNMGIAFTFCAPREEELLEEIQGFIGKEIKALEIDKDSKAEILSLTKEKELTMKRIIDNLDDLAFGDGII